MCYIQVRCPTYMCMCTRIKLNNRGNQKLNDSTNAIRKIGKLRKIAREMAAEVPELQSRLE